MNIKRMIAVGSLLGATFVLTPGARPALADGSVGLTTLGVAYSEYFDTLAIDEASSTVPDGWAFAEAGTNANTTYTPGTGSSNAGDTYSFGAVSDIERAFGGVQSGSLIPTIGASFTNNTGSAITQLAIAYTGEQWRLGTVDRVDRLDFQYSTDATALNTGTWVNVDALDFTAPNTGPNTGLLVGNDPANQTAVSGTITGVNIASGASFWIRWSDFNASGSDDGLAVDGFSLTPSSTEQPPIVTATVPAAGATNVPVDAGVTVTFSEAVNVTSAWFTLTCATTGLHEATFSGGPTTFTIDPGTDFAEGESCTLTVLADQVSDQDGIDPPDNMTANFTAGFSTSVVRSIHEIEGAGHLSPYNGQSVTTRPAIVTALRTEGSTRGFYIQDAVPDTDDATSEGLFVFTGGSSDPAALAHVGDLVQVGGRVSEFRGAATGLTITELVGPLTVSTLSQGNTLPAPVVIGAGGRIPPNQVIEDDAAGSVETSGVFDPANDGIDFYESLEGMLVELHDVVATGPTSDFGSNREISVIGADTGASLRTTRGGIVISATDFNPERVILNDWISGGPDLPAVNVSDSFPGDTVGVIDYSFGNFKLQVTSLPDLSRHGLQPETTATPSKDELAVATFNVENLAPGDPPAKFARLAELIVKNLAAPDVIAIEEIQDNNGTVNDGTVDASVTWNMLIAAISAAGGPAYQYRQIDPVNGQDGGAPGGNIRQGFLFRTDRGLSFVDKAGGGSTTPTGVTGSGAATHLTSNPGRIDPTNSAFTASRKPLAAEFMFGGERVFVIANHFNSKGGDDPLFGVRQPPVRSSETQRAAQAQVENDFVAAILAADPSANVVALGDINDFEFSNTMSILAGTELNVLMDTLPPAERYTYVFEGNSQALDHTLISDALSTRPFVYDVVHVNSEFADQASDHDPQVTRFGLGLNDAPSVSAAFTQSRVACGTGNATLVVTFSDPDLGDSHTATISWGDGTSTKVDPATSPFELAHTYALAGAYTASVTVTDSAGASDSATADVAVDYTTAGVLQPINPDGSSVFKYGRTIPVKIGFVDCDGTIPTGLGPKISLMLISGASPGTAINEPESTSGADTTGVMRFSDGKWIYNLATRPLPDSSARYRVTISLANGQIVTAIFGLRP